LKFTNANVAKHAAWMMSGAVIQAAAAFATNLVLVRVLLPEDFGRFTIVMANIGLAQSIVSVPIGTVVLRASEEELEQKLSLYAAVNIIQNVTVLVIASSVLLSIQKFDLRAILLLISFISSNWISVQMNLYERRFVYGKLSILETLAHLLGHIFAIVGALSGIGSVVLYGRELVRQISLILGLRYLNGLQSIKLRWLRLEDWKELLKTIHGFWLDGFLESSFGRLVILTVGSLSGEAGAGYFFQAQRLAIIPHQFLQPVTQRLAINYFSHKSSHDKQTKHLAKGLMSLSGILLLAVIIIRLGAPTVIPVVFGDSWRPVIPILIAMLGFVLCATMFNLLKGYCIATKNLKTLIVLGRSGQYLGFLSVATLVSILDYEPSVGLAFGLSLGYLLAAVSLTLKIFSKKEYSLL